MDIWIVWRCLDSFVEDWEIDEVFITRELAEEYIEGQDKNLNFFITKGESDIPL